METNRQETNEIEIDLWELIREIWGRIGYVICAAFAMAMLFILFDKVIVTPQYVSTTKMYVLAQQDSSKLTSSDLQASALITQDYAELIKSRKVTESVISQLGLTSGDEMMTHEQMLEKLTVETTSNTRIVTIKVEDPDPYVACEIANAIRDAAAEHIQNVMMTEAVNVVDEANIPKDPSSPNTMRDAVIGGFLGMIIAMAVIIISYLMNDTIKTSEDIEKYLGLGVLGIIPISEGQKKSGRKKNKRARRK